MPLVVPLKVRAFPPVRRRSALSLSNVRGRAIDTVPTPGLPTHRGPCPSPPHSFPMGAQRLVAPPFLPTMTVHSDSQNLQNAWVDHLRRLEWSHAFDLTTRYPSSPETLDREFARALRLLARAAQRPLRAFVAFERTTEGHWHAHALLGGTEGLSTSRMQATWRSGHSRARTLKRPEAAIRYATKWAPRNADNYRLYGRDELWR